MNIPEKPYGVNERNEDLSIDFNTNGDPDGYQDEDDYIRVAIRVETDQSTLHFIITHDDGYQFDFAHNAS